MCKNGKPIMCGTNGCRNKAAKRRRFCHACHSRRYRLNNPLRASYNDHKTNAKRRGIPFTITFEQFEQFAYENDYHVGQGRTKNAHSVDRIDPDKGYIPGNLQKLTVSENSRKGAKKLVFEWGGSRDKSSFRVVKNNPTQKSDDDPF